MLYQTTTEAKIRLLTTGNNSHLKAMKPLQSSLFTRSFSEFAPSKLASCFYRIKPLELVLLSLRWSFCNFATIGCCGCRYVEDYPRFVIVIQPLKAQVHTKKTQRLLCIVEHLYNLQIKKKIWRITEKILNPVESCNGRGCGVLVIYVCKTIFQL